MPLNETVQGAKSPVEVSAEILKVLRSRGEQALGGDLFGAVITVPAYFDDAQRQATKDAAKLRSEEHTSELQSRPHLVCRLLLEKKKLIQHKIFLMRLA